LKRSDLQLYIDYLKQQQPSICTLYSLSLLLGQTLSSLL
jgi:hypothetical protein